ncbi:unnamed protein product [marine sediment metagenome]|uniref:Ribbon-helix-helix protein CopG domain-containing protein n=1 Tax=marine sediment metagenome TaxID=412755 RepID=X1Q3K1_9ZZZZ
MFTLWGRIVYTMVKGRNTTVIGVRVPDKVNTRIEALAEKQGLTRNDWAKAALIRAAGLLPDGGLRSHHKESP